MAKFECDVIYYQGLFLTVTALPTTAFIDPTGDNHDEIKALLSQVTTLLLEEMSQAMARSPLS